MVAAEEASVAAVGASFWAAGASPPPAPLAVGLRAVSALTTGMNCRQAGLTAWILCPCPHFDLQAHVQRRYSSLLRLPSPLPLLALLPPPPPPPPPQQQLALLLPPPLLLSAAASGCLPHLRAAPVFCDARQRQHSVVQGHEGGPLRSGGREWAVVKRWEQPRLAEPSFLPLALALALAPTCVQWGEGPRRTLLHHKHAHPWGEGGPRRSVLHPPAPPGARGQTAPGAPARPQSC